MKFVNLEATWIEITSLEGSEMEYRWRAEKQLLKVEVWEFSDTNIQTVRIRCLMNVVLVTGMQWEKQDITAAVMINKSLYNAFVHCEVIYLEWAYFDMNVLDNISFFLFGMKWNK